MISYTLRMVSITLFVVWVGQVIAPVEIQKVTDLLAPFFVSGVYVFVVDEYMNLATEK